MTEKKGWYRNIMRLLEQNLELEFSKNKAESYI
jgi:hypothetical protein